MYSTWQTQHEQQQAFHLPRSSSESLPQQQPSVDLSSSTTSHSPSTILSDMSRPSSAANSNGGAYVISTSQGLYPNEINGEIRGVRASAGGGGGQLEQEWDVGELDKFYSSFPSDTQFDRSSAPSFPSTPLNYAFDLQNPASFSPSPDQMPQQLDNNFGYQQPQQEPLHSSYVQSQPSSNPPLPQLAPDQPQYYSSIPGDFDTLTEITAFNPPPPMTYQQQQQQFQQLNGGFLDQDAFFASLNATNALPQFAFDKIISPQQPQQHAPTELGGGRGHGRGLRAGEEGEASKETGARRLAESMNLVSVREERDVEMDGEKDEGTCRQVRTYIESRNRFADGERTVIIMTPKVGQKSYKAEKRFLCPPPSALLAGPHWFSPLTASDPSSSPASSSSSQSHLNSPSTPVIHMKITNEAPPLKQSTPIWTSALGTDITSSANSLSPNEIPIHGVTLGKQLFVSEGENLSASAGGGGGKRIVKTRVKVVLPRPGVAAGDEGAERGGLEIGTFESKEIKVISKPARKKAAGGGSVSASAAKGVELAMHHGTLISAFQRVRSQTSNTRYLSVSDSASHLKATDGSGLVSTQVWNQRRANSSKPPMFEAGTSHWDSFIIWLVDCRTLRPPARDKAKGTSSFSLLDPDWPEPPINALPYDASRLTAICFNHTVVLQCPKSGVISPILIVRRIDQATTALGGEPSLGETSIAADVCVPPGERAGDQISQLQKVAFELYSPTVIPLDPTKAGISGAFLSIIGDKVQTSCPTNARTLFPHAGGGNDSSESSPPTTTLPRHNSNTSTPASPSADPAYHPDASSNGGKVSTVKRRTSASSLLRPTSAALKGKGKKRTNSTEGGSRPPVGAGPSGGDPGGVHGESARWWIELPGEMCVWTIVGVESVRYTFFIPPAGSDEGVGGGWLSGPVTPLPEVLRYLPPGIKTENDPHGGGYKAQFISTTTEEMITVYGHSFPKDPKTSFSSYDLLFDAEPSPHVELRCQEVLAAVVPPEAKRDVLERGRSRRLGLRRKGDGVVVLGRGGGVEYLG